MAKMTHVSLLLAYNGHPFAITDQALKVMVAIASRKGVSAEELSDYRRSGEDRPPPSAFMALPGSIVDGAEVLRLRENGVGVLAIQGPMIRHADLFDDISGVVSMARLSNELQIALDSPGVKSIVLDIESPGGEVPSEFAEMVRQADSVKPVTAYIGNWGMSAAYWIATGAGRTVAHRTAYTGSVGVRATFIDTTRMEEAIGIDKIEMMADQSPDKIADPKTPEGKALIQKILNKTAEDFIEDVARNRNVSQKRVRSDFGKGAAVDAPRAAEVGMIDALDTMEGVIKAVGGGRRYKSTRVSSGSNGASSMAGKRLLVIREDEEDVKLVSGLSMVSGSPILKSSQDAPGQADTDDPQELRRQLEAERAARMAAEQRASESDQVREKDSIAAQERDIKAKVRGWVGKKVHPVESARVEQLCLALAATDRKHGTTLLDDYVQSIEGRPSHSTTDEVVAQGKLPAGSKAVQPPVSPSTVDSRPDTWSTERALAKQEAINEAGLGDPAKNGRGHK